MRYYHEMYNKIFILVKYRDVCTFAVRVLKNQYMIRILILVRNRIITNHSNSSEVQSKG